MDSILTAENIAAVTSFIAFAAHISTAMNKPEWVGKLGFVSRIWDVLASEYGTSKIEQPKKEG